MKPTEDVFEILKEKFCEVLDHFTFQVLDATEIEKGNGAVATKNIVAGVRVTVEETMFEE